jgi:hypothetical protein
MWRAPISARGPLVVGFGGRLCRRRSAEQAPRWREPQAIAHAEAQFDSGDFGSVLARHESIPEAVATC